MLDHPKTPKSYYLRQLEEIAKIANYYPIASIPQPNNDFNYTIAKPRYTRYSQYDPPRLRPKPPPQVSQGRHQLKLTTILETSSPHNLFPKINNRRQQGSNSPQNKPNSPKHKYTKLRSHFTRQTTSISRQNSLTIDTRIETESELGLIGNNESRKSVRNETKKVNQVNSRLILQSKLEDRSLQQQSEEESESEEFEKDAVPGPGSYTYTYSDFQKQTTKRSTAVTFLSKSSRFPSIRKGSPSPLQTPLPPVQEELFPKNNKKRQNKSIAFGSESPRRYEFEYKAKEFTPGPQHYSPRHGLEQDLIRRIQRNFKSSFGSNLQRFPPQASELVPHLGPGVYYKEEQQDLLQNEGSNFKSLSKRFQ